MKERRYSSRPLAKKPFRYTGKSPCFCKDLALTYTFGFSKKLHDSNLFPHTFITNLHNLKVTVWVDLDEEAFQVAIDGVPFMNLRYQATV